jgi:hypothetical protein
MKEEKLKATETENCVICGEATAIPMDRPIHLRDYYVEGIGQLCFSCGRELSDG